MLAVCFALAAAGWTPGVRIRCRGLHMRDTTPEDTAVAAPDVAEAAEAVRSLLDEAACQQKATVADAVAACAAASRVVVFTGAGASADSGIGTFRGASGAWSGVFGRLSLVWGGTPLGWRWTPGLVWSRFVADFLEPINAARPHDGHLALARLEQALPVDTITMNVDGLHQAAGAANVAEVHGSVRRMRCMECRQRAGLPATLDASRQPRCDACGGRMRPDVTLFTEGLPDAEWRRAQAAIEALSPGDVLLAVGTSSVVYPAASLPSRAKARGATIIEFNMQVPTPLSAIVDVTVTGPAAESLPTFVDGVLAARQRR